MELGKNSAGIEQALITIGAAIEGRVVAVLDANGWLYRKFGTTEIWTKRVTFSQTVNNGAGVTITLSSSLLPAGVADVSNVNFQYSVSTTNGNAYALNLVAEMATNAASLNFTATRFIVATGTVSGYINVMVIR